MLYKEDVSGFSERMTTYGRAFRNAFCYIGPDPTDWRDSVLEKLPIKVLNETTPRSWILVFAPESLKAMSTLDRFKEKIISFLILPLFEGDHWKLKA
ncbi:hypothetical protein PROFUN_15179 [Planoprotostelium fungivorum]|uniref:Uncharacterized protein n=1 Tax=Planoprotostelium fungivorum TaxID=1890364 RepID=A0A2P6MVX3_9EUKA|nr:hypothetical protein PROFUN_15179 [Planoprotostelium fungivorum]